MVLSLRGSTTTNGGENSSSMEFEEQLNLEEEAIRDEIKAGIKQLAEQVNKHKEYFAEINQKLIALQQQIQSRYPHIRNLDLTTQKFTTDLELRVAYSKSKFGNQDSSIRKGSTTTITGQESKITEQQKQISNNNSKPQESHQEEPDQSDQIMQPSPSPDLSGGVATVGGAPPDPNNSFNDLNSGDEASSSGDYGDPSVGVDHDLRSSTFGGDGTAVEVEEAANVEQKKNRGERRSSAEARAEATAAKIEGGEGIVVVKHSEPLREEDDGGDILQIWWRFYVTEVEEAMAMNGLAKEEAVSGANLAGTFRAVGRAPVLLLVLASDIPSRMKGVKKRERPLLEGDKDVDAMANPQVAAEEDFRARGAWHGPWLVAIGGGTWKRGGGTVIGIRKGRVEEARATLAFWHLGFIFAQMGPDQAQFTKEKKLGYFSEGHVLFMSMGQLQSESNFDLAFGDKGACWVMANGLYFKQWDPGGVSFLVQ